VVTLTLSHQFWDHFVLELAAYTKKQTADGRTDGQAGPVTRPRKMVA